MNLTKEQQQVVDYAKSITDPELLLIDSVAGSGKTTLLKAIATELGEGAGLYLAYNKSIATSSAKKFPNHIDCRTTHSIAYQATVKPLKLKVGFFGVNNIKEAISFSDKYILVENIKEFCLSKYLTYGEFAEAENRSQVNLANKYLTLMVNGDIDCTHDFYLKLFHMLLAANDIEQVDYNLIMLDEAGDLNEVTLEIFKLLKGRVKVAVGDPHQNIYTFNYTINCFENLKEKGTTFNLSKSFRVPEHIAEPVEKFCKKYLNETMKFEGVPLSTTEIKTRAYISRTNSGLIEKIIELNNSNTPYGLVRNASEIFKIPLMVAGIKYQGTIYDAQYKHLQEDIDDWFENKNGVQSSYKTVYSYLKNKHLEDLALVQAINLLKNYTKTDIFNAYAEAKKHENKKQNFLLLTAHSSKGLEFDEVIIAADMNNSLAKVLNALDLTSSDQDIQKFMSPSMRETLNLYYVACTRALVRLTNATGLVGT
jgi:F-box protein 18 (helicase)